MKQVLFGICVGLLAMGFFAFVVGAPYADMRLPLIPDFKEGKVLFVGDMMLGRFVETQMNTYGEEYPFENVSAWFEEYDVVVGNLEGPILENHVQTPNHSLSFSFDPRVANLLNVHGVDVVSLANNHTHDKLESGFLETQKHLDDAGVAYFGHPLQVTSEYVYMHDVGDTKVIFVGANVTYYSTFDLKETVEVIEGLEEVYPEALIVFQPHWGEEYVRTHSPWQEEIAHAVIDAGSDLVIGHHPHVVQDTEEYNGKMIFYSLGNFIFDQIEPETKKGLAVEMHIQKNEVVYTLYPIQIEGARPSVGEREKQVSMRR